MLIPILLAASAGHVAVLEFVNEEPQVDRAAVAQRVRDTAPKGVEVMTRAQMFQIASANPDALNKCDDRSCIEVGRLLGADTVIDGRIFRIGANIRLTLKMVDTRGGRTLATVVATGKDQAELMGNVERAVTTLFRRAFPTSASPEFPPA